MGRRTPQLATNNNCEGPFKWRRPEKDCVANMKSHSTQFAVRENTAMPQRQHMPRAIKESSGRILIEFFEQRSCTTVTEAGREEGHLLTVHEVATMLQDSCFLGLRTHAQSDLLNDCRATGSENTGDSVRPKCWRGSNAATARFPCCMSTRSTLKSEAQEKALDGPSRFPEREERWLRRGFQQ